MVFCQKSHRKSSSFKKVNFEKYFCAIFLFLSRFQDFWNRKICFFASKKIPTGYAYFFACKFPSQIRAGNPLWLCTAGETAAKLLTIWILYNYPLKLELLLGNLKIVLPLVHSSFDFSFLVSKNWVKEVWNWSTFWKQSESASFCKNRLKAQFHT